MNIIPQDANASTPSNITVTGKPAILGPIKCLEGNAKTRRMVYLSHGNGWTCHYCHAPLNSPESMSKRREAHTLFDHGVIPFAQYQSLMAKSTYHKNGMPTLDHKVPQSSGGTHDVSNLVLCCLSCNSQKSNRYTYEDFLAKKCAEVAK